MADSKTNMVQKMVEGIVNSTIEVQPCLDDPEQVAREAKARTFLGKQMRVEIIDGRIVQGTLTCIDDHCNLVLREAYQINGVSAKGDEPQRTRLGQVVVAQKFLVSCQVAQPVPVEAIAKEVEAEEAPEEEPLICGGFSEPEPVLCGGFSGASGGANEEVNALLAGVKAELDSRTGGGEWTVLSYQTQVVAGLNYLIKLKVGDKTFSVKIYKPLPHTGDEPELTDVTEL